MAPLKLPQGYRCKLFGSSRNSLGLGDYEPQDCSSTQLLPPMTPVEVEGGERGDNLAFGQFQGFNSPTSDLHFYFT
jgi:hypothetical protein